MEKVAWTLFKPGKRTKSRRELAETRYVLRYWVHGRTKQETLHRDLEASEADRRRIIERVEQQAAGIATTDDEGLRRPLAVLLAEYERSIGVRGATARYVAMKVNRIRRVLDGVHARTLAQLETVPHVLTCDLTKHAYLRHAWCLTHGVELGPQRLDHLRD